MSNSHSHLPRVSIVIPSYNQAPYLETCIRSIITQDYPRSKLEVLCLDGGSTDGSSGIIEKYRHEFNFWRSSPDGGQAAAINEGLERSSGEVVAWLNSDDVYLPGTIRRAVLALDRHEAEATIGDAYHWDVRTKQLFLVKGMQPDLRLLRWYGNPIAQPACFWRRRVVEKHGPLDAALHRHLDFELHLRYLSRGVRYHYAPDARAVILWHGANKSGNLLGQDELDRLWQAYGVRTSRLSRAAGKAAFTLRHLRAGRLAYLAAVGWKALRGPRNSLGAPVSARQCVSAVGAELAQELASLGTPLADECLFSYSGGCDKNGRALASDE